MTDTPLLTLEAQVIGAILADDSLFPRASFLSEDAFGDAGHRVLWKLIEGLYLSGGSVDPATVTMSYPEDVAPLGGLEYLNRLAALGEAITTGFGLAVDRLHEELQWRRVASLAARMQSAATSREKQPEQILSSVVDIIRTHLSGGHVGFRGKREVARVALENAQDRKEAVTTGIDSLDFLMQGGLQKQRLLGMGGLYGRGKTILLGTISDNLNIQKVPHLFFSLETPPEDIEIRSCARHLNLNASSILDPGDPDHQTFVSSTEAYINALPDYAIYEFSPQATMDEIHRKILAAKARHGIEGFVLDYWQLIRGRERGQSEEAHLRDCADRLAGICRQENLWGIMAAQVDERGRLLISDSLLRSASLFVRLVREENETASFFVTDKSNYTRYADTGSESVPGMVFDDACGPHFRNTEATDIGGLNQEGDILL